MNSAKRLILQNSFWLLLEKMILMAGGLLLSIAFARNLGPEAFGRYNYLLSFTALLVPLFALGMTNVLLREFSRSPQRSADILTTCRQSRIVAGLGVTIPTLLIVLAVFGANWKFEALSLLLVANISNAYEVFERWFQHKSMNGVLVRWRVSNFTVFALLKLLLVSFYPDVLLLVCLLSLEILSKNLGYRLLYRRFRQTPEHGRFDSALFKDIFAQTRFLLLSGLASVIYLKIDILMLEAMAGDEQTGIYSVAAKLSEVWYVLPQVVISAMFPKLLEIAASSKQRYQTILQQGFDLLFIAASVVSGLVFILSPWLIGWLYGERYQSAVVILQLHVFASLFIYMRVLLSQWLVSEQFAEFSLFSQLSGALTNVLLNLWLIPLYGAWGAAVATVVSYAVTTYFCLFFHPRTRPLAWMMTKSMLFPLRLGQVLSSFTK